MISVIIPAFNAEKTLRRCLDSILRQTYSELEVIVIDDGSSDGTLELCNELSLNDSRINIIHQSNHGSNYSRKAGLSKAKGEYVLQVDADDWLEPDMLERMHDEAEKTKADMVICDFYEHRADETVVSVERPSSYDSKTVLSEIFEGKLKGSVWNKLVRRNLFERYHVTFPNDIFVLEDVFANAQLLLHPLKIVNTPPRALYHYDRTANPYSITVNKHPEWNKTANGIVTHFRELLEKTDFWPIWVENELPWIAYLCLYYHSFKADKYQREFHYLKDLNVKIINPWVRLSLQNYFVALSLMKARRMASKLIHG